MSSTVTIVVPTYNSALTIEKCLQSIIGQTYSPIELIVVDNNSSDQTFDLALKYTDKVYNFGSERSSQRNFGLISSGTGEFGMYIDSDMILSPSVVEACVLEYERSPAIAGVYIQEVILGKGLFYDVKRFERYFYTATPIDAVRFFRLKEFRSFGGFDEAIFFEGSGEDWDLDLQLHKFGQFKVALGEQEDLISWDLFSYCAERCKMPQGYGPWIFHDESRLTLLSYIKKKIYYSKGFDRYIHKWGRENRNVKLQFSVLYRFFGVFFHSQEKRGFLFKNLHLYSLFIFLKCLVGVGFIFRQRMRFHE